MNIILLGRMPAAGESRLRKLLGDEHRITSIREPSSFHTDLDVYADADVIVGGPVDETIVVRANRLKLFHVFRGGIDGLGVGLLPEGVSIANTFHHEVGVAEFAILACLMLPRQIAAHDAMLRKGDWSGSVMWGEPPEYKCLQSSTALVVGVGHIGSCVVSRLSSFGTRIVTVSRTPESKRQTEGVSQVFGYEQLHKALGEADFVILTVRLSDQTEGLIGASELAAMKDDAYLINVARGGVVDQHALYEALASHRIAGAAIDVWYNYPTERSERCLPSDAPIYELENVLLSPNRSSWTETMLDGRVADVAENVRRLADGRDLINVVRAGTP